MTKQHAQNALEWVKGNVLVLAVLIFQLIQFGLGQGFEIAAHAKELRDLKGQVAEVRLEAASKELVSVKLEALRVELQGLRESLQQHMNETRGPGR